MHPEHIIEFTRHIVRIDFPRTPIKPKPLEKNSPHDHLAFEQCWFCFHSIAHANYSATSGCYDSPPELYKSEPVIMPKTHSKRRKQGHNLQRKPASSKNTSNKRSSDVEQRVTVADTHISSSKEPEWHNSSYTDDSNGTVLFNIDTDTCVYEAKVASDSSQITSVNSDTISEILALQNSLHQNLTTLQKQNYRNS
ncbi:hypothetical protein QAD02_011552 [Eretmocerus hayati]|uniref:Uncharacterized protein n=1 Tax=Eretmocerus hayati TaxID=131215 RepID=A0ACC2NY85_9HYME|nr:hypothetical protein QAD02_011552 [Eretmocerus hayati]